MPPRHIQYPLREAQLSKKYRIKNRGGNRKCLHNRKKTNRLSSSAIMRWSEVTRTPFFASTHKGDPQERDRRVLRNMTFIASMGLAMILAAIFTTVLE